MDGYNNKRGNFQPKDEFADVKKEFDKLQFQEKWILNGADDKLPKFAEEAGKYMAKGNLTSSKIRSIYGEIKRIQMGDYEKEKAAFYLLRPKVAYALGREEKFKRNGLILFQLIFEEAASLVSDKRTFNHFCELMEAILAYHRVYGK